MDRGGFFGLVRFEGWRSDGFFGFFDQELFEEETEVETEFFE